jgi:heavy metal efflux system protein
MFVQLARRRIVGILLLLAILAAAGAYQASGLPSAILPSVTFPIVKVIADAGEEPAAHMMPTVTRPLEEAILRVPGIELVRSITSRGSSELSAQFRWGTDMPVALQRVQAETERIRPDLPPDTKIDVEWMNPAVFVVQGYALVSNRESLAQLTVLAEYTLKPALVRIPGVSQVQIQGGRRREFEVHLDRQALEGRRLAVSDVIDAIQKNHQVQSAGLTERNHELYLTLVNGRVHDLEGLRKLAVPVPNGPPATLGELGTVRVDDEVSYIRNTADGHPAVLLNIIQQPSANTVAIADGIRQLFRDQPDLLPKDVRWTTFYDQAQFVTDSVGGTRDAILIGVGLAALVLLLFLRNWRLTLVAVVAIPLTVAIVGLLLGVLGQTINLMTLAGIAAALGLIADDAIVVVEDVEHHQARIAREGGSEDAASVSVRELLPALIGSSLSTTVILLPFALLSGIVGAFFKPLALTMALTLLVSFFIALVVVPVVVSAVGPARGGARSGGKRAPLSRFWRRHGGAPVDEAWSRLRGRLGTGYAWVVHLFVAHGATAVVTMVVLIATAWLLYGRIGTDFLPSMDEGSIILDYWTPPGTSLAETDEMLRQAEKVITSLPDVASYSRRLGTQLGFFITEPNGGDYVIKLKPRGQRRDVDAVIEALRTRIAAVEPAIHTDFGQLIEDEIGDLTGGEPQPIDIKLFGDDAGLLQAKARQVARSIAKVRGIEDVFDGIVIAGPALQVDVDALAAARFGLTTEQIHAAVEPAVTGTVVDQVRIGERMYDLRVFAAPAESLGSLKLRAPAGLITLSNVATVSTGAPEVEIRRENLKTFVGVTARLSGRDLGSTMSDVRRTLASQGVLAPGITVRYGGLFEQQQQSFRSLLYVLLAGLVLVAVIVLFEFADWRAPIVTAVCAATVLAGVLAALLLTGQTLNISSYVGAIMMVGIAGENAIFVIHEAKLALHRGLSPRAAWVEAAHRRLRPVAMTILATAFALAPLALALGQGSQLMQPLAIAVIGGFVLSGPVVLLVLPGLYHLLDPRGQLGQGTTAHDSEQAS